MEHRISRKAGSIASSLTLAIDGKLKQMVADGIKVYGFGAGEPDFNTPGYIQDAAIEALKNGMTRYTAVSGTLELRKAICGKLKRENNLDYKPEQIIASSGAKHSLTNACATILDPGDEVIIPVPYWVSYTEIVKLNDGVPVLVETQQSNGFKMTGEEFRNAITPKTKAVLINTPNNPTGAIYSKEELQVIADIAEEKDLYIISDEIYERLTYDGKKHVSIATLGENIKDRTILINGMSKSYAMTGWRLGYLAANEKLIKAMSSVQSHAVSHPSSITQHASTVALNGPQDDLKNMVVEFEKRRTYMYDRMTAIEGVTCVMPEGAFYVYADISSFYGKEFCGEKLTGSLQFANLLLEKGHVAVVPGAAFGTDDFIRLSYATSMETIEKGIDKIESFLKENLKECKK